MASGLEHRLERLRVVARPHLEGIQRETGETVNLVVLDADRVVYVDQVEGSRQRAHVHHGRHQRARPHDRLGQGDHGQRPAGGLRGALRRPRAAPAADRAHADHARRARGRLRAHPPPRLRARQRGARGGRRLRRRGRLRPQRPRERRDQRVGAVGADPGCATRRGWAGCWSSTPRRCPTRWASKPRPTPAAADPASRAGARRAPSARAPARRRGSPRSAPGARRGSRRCARR